MMRFAGDGGKERFEMLKINSSFELSDVMPPCDMVKDRQKLTLSAQTSLDLHSPVRAEPLIFLITDSSLGQSMRFQLGFIFNFISFPPPPTDSPLARAVIKIAISPTDQAI